MTKRTLNDFFCGAGGMGIGFKQAGFEINGAWDFDKFAVQSYAHNVGDHVQQADISEMNIFDVPHSDVWAFGFPCQDLSNAGKQAGLYEGKRSKMFFEIMRLLDEAIEEGIELPKVLMAENVRGLKKYLPILKEEYNKRGYRMTFTLYNSKFWGVPQNRERYFVVGIREDLKRAFQFPRQQTDYIPKLSDVLEKNADEKYYANNSKAMEIIERSGDFLHVRQATIKGYAEATEGDSINISHPNSKTRRGRVGNKVAQTLLTGQEQLFVDEGLRVRKLTPREFARLQGFPDSYEQIVSNNQFYKQMGNAVTVNVAAAIAEHIKSYLDGEPYPIGEAKELVEVGS